MSDRPRGREVSAVLESEIAGALVLQRPLTFVVECRSLPDAPSERHHLVTVQADGTVTTPHDLDTERIAAPFGAYCSCLVLADRVIPAVRALTPLLARRTRPALVQRDDGTWHIPARGRIRGCCTRALGGLPGVSIERAITHLRGALHLSAHLGVPAWQIPAVSAAFEQDQKPDLLAHPSAALVREPHGLELLWRSGIHPDDLGDLARWAAPVQDPLPVSYFEAAAYTTHPLGWMGRVLAHHPDADAAAWLVQQVPPQLFVEVSDWDLWPPDVEAAAREWAQWLGYDLSWDDYAFAIRHPLPASRVTEVGELTGWTPRLAAQQIVDWAKADCLLTPHQFAEVARRGAEFATPSLATVDAVEDLARMSGVTLDRAELGLLVALLGDRDRAVDAAVQAGRGAG